MKNKILLPLLLALAIPAGAQTATNSTATNQVPNLLTNTFTLSGLFSGGVWTGIEKGGEDLVAFVENTTNSGTLQIESGPLYAENTKKWGAFLDAYLPVGGTNSIFGTGFGFACLDQNFYDATLNARLGNTYTVPFIKLPVYAFIESGGGWNLSKNEAMAQAFAGGLISVPITPTQTFTVGGAVGTISDYAGDIIAVGISYTFTF
jgi:hypothetical protein